ncbi:helix-turn-helix transcriptional regulator [Sporosarcina jiandibaonis]|uniref:helix-turn-helix transcriptional regulator n=1 Tax=Sporosarcina jiandibaonis TaxID=2715535 RepID=UPI001557D086|nr:helix-turn-helix domain-containing protein [Sporosarcina jiandibaonis]
MRYNYKLYIYRRENRLRQVDMAKILEITPQTYYVKENGKSEFTISEGLKLAKFFGCTLDDLFG